VHVVIGRGARSGVGIALVAAVTAMLLVAAPAGGTPVLAAQPGHVFAFAFGSRGTGDGQFNTPSGVAVNDSSGDVYVSDSSEGRLQEFEPAFNGAGELVNEIFLREVKLGSPGEIAVDNCTHEGAPCSASEDPSVGDVYVVGAKKQGAAMRLLKFSANLQPLTPIKTKEPAVAVAVDPTGKVFVAQAGGKRAISLLDHAEPNGLESSITAGFEGELERALAVDPADGLYAAHLPSESEGGVSGTPLSNLYTELAKENAEVTAARRRAWLVSKLEADTGKPRGVLGFEPAGAVAVDAANGEVYAADNATIANQTSATVGVFAPAAGEGAEADAGQLTEQMSAPGLEEGAGIAVSATSGAVYVADAGSGRVYVFESEEHAASVTDGRPKVGGVSAESAGGGTIILSANVDADGAPTMVHFEYGASACPTGCASTPPTAIGAGFGDVPVEAQLPGVSPGAYEFRVVAESPLGSATAGSEQPFSIAASAGVLPDGRAWELVSPPNDGGAEPYAMSELGSGVTEAAEDGDAVTYLADGPMPANAEVEGGRGPEPNQIVSERTPNWSSRDINTSNSTGAGSDIGEPPEYQFFSSDLALALVRPFAGAAGALASPPLSPPVAGEDEESRKQENTIYLHANQPVPGASEDLLQPSASEQVSYEQALKNGEEEHNQGFVALVTQLNEPNPGYGERQGTGAQGLRAEGATADLSHVVLDSTVGTRPGLYEWSAPSALDTEAPLAPVSVMPDDEGGALASPATLGGPYSEAGKDYEVTNAISQSGAFVFWTYEHHLYVRDIETEKSLLLSGGQPTDDAVFQAARPDGSQVFFTDGQRLTPDSTAAPGRPDLYAAEVSVAGEQLTSQLTDLTAQSRESAGLLVKNEEGGGIIGAGEPQASEAPVGERGSYVYFVADSALAPGAHRGHCDGVSDATRPQGTTCNLYVRHYDEARREWEPTRLVAALSAEDLPDWDGGETGDATFETARVSPNGRYLAFMSDRSLTGYDTVDVDEQDGQHLDEEVYLYDATAQRLVCASCNPSGARPAGVFDPGNGVNTGEGLGLLVDRPGIWGPHAEGHPVVDHWLAASVPGWTPISHHGADYQSRYLSNDGRLFFDSPGRLIPAATGSKEKVYEYEPDGVGSCAGAGGCIGLISAGDSPHEAAFLDASANGNDVFFASFDELTSQQVEGGLDVYDAHVCAEGGCPPAPAAPSPPCEEAACQGTFAVAPASQSSGSAAFSGPGNLLVASGVLGATSTAKPKPKPKPLTRAQKLTRALVSCRKKHRHSRHAKLACERRARRSYGPAKRPAKKSSSAR
jgi:DNA-binding beta-propeller fold protein YncE